MQVVPVVPYVGTWIEIPTYPLLPDHYHVVPYVGTWIEIVGKVNDALGETVVPYVGTWIEMRKQRSKPHQSKRRSLRGNVDRNAASSVGAANR